MGAVGLVPAELTSLVFETILTGIALVLFCIAIYVLVFMRGLSPGSKSSASPFNRILFVVTIALLCAVLAVSIPFPRKIFLRSDLAHFLDFSTGSSMSAVHLMHSSMTPKSQGQF